jgi:hypothetical protein
MKAYTRTILILLGALSIFSTLNAKEEFSRLNRVFEVENNIKTRSTLYIKKFIPENKFSLEVKITPLLRNYQNSNPENNSNLPFYDLSEQDALDEWEDPLYPIDSLFQRIKEAELTLKIDDGYIPKNISLFKENILREAGLKVGRDDIKIEFVAFTLVEKKIDLKEMFSNPEFIQTFSLIIFAIFSLLLLSRFTKQTRGDQETGKKESNNIQTATPAPSMPRAHTPSFNQGAQEIKGDLSLSDPLQVSRIIKQKITVLLSDENFPLLQDLILFEELLTANANAFAYLIYEFPLTMQEKIFKYGRDEKWNKGFLEAGIADKKVILTLDQMLRERNQNKDHSFEKLIISLWRMSPKKLEYFLKDVDSEISIGLLYHLPKELSLPVARKLYPGNWAKTLSENPPYNFDDQNMVNKTFEQALKAFPLFEIESLRVSKNKKDLLRYLYYAEPKEEEEIYSITGSMYSLTSVRPPFFSFFKLNEDKKKTIFSQYSIEQWALISFNASREYRTLLNELMDDKQKYLFSLSLKLLDSTQSVDLIERGKLREEIGLLSHDTQEQNHETKETIIEEDSHEENDMAA